MLSAVLHVFAENLNHAITIYRSSDLHWIGEDTKMHHDGPFKKLYGRILNLSTLQVD